jgi:hypothetical protein
MPSKADVLTVTAGGTVPEFHRLAYQLSPRSPLGTLPKLLDLLTRIAQKRKHVNFGDIGVVYHFALSI